HRLHTINIDDTELNLNATIPNESAPEAIGKPGESIYSVRFDGDKAYIVTFRQIDPFYVLDLSNHDSPRVAGELELPGFSNYLHPFGDTL
ncbi:beta-propeller domain-containing protein, partial [Oleiphilus sp. HI0123]